MNVEGRFWFAIPILITHPSLDSREAEQREEKKRITRGTCTKITHRGSFCVGRTTHSAVGRITYSGSSAGHEQLATMGVFFPARTTVT